MPVISIDTSALTSPRFTVLDVTGWRDGADPTDRQVTLPAGIHRLQQGGGEISPWSFSVDAAGTITVDPAYAAFLSVVGNTLVVGGFDVVLDGTALATALYPQTGAYGPLSNSTTHTVTLPPSDSVSFVVASGIVSTFSLRVGVDGAITVPPRWSAVASVSGNVVTLRGHEVTFVNDGLSHRLFSMATEQWIDPGDSLTLRLLPASYYGFQAGSGMVGEGYVTVTEGGTIDYPSDCDGFFSGRGTRTLSVGGFPVVVDARSADGDLLGLPNAGLSAQTPDFLFAVLLPCPYYTLQSTAGVFGVNFAVGKDGSVHVDPGLAGRMDVATIACVMVTGATPI